MSKVLIVIDYQNDFVYGPLGTTEAKLIHSCVRAKVIEYKNREDRVIFTRDVHTKNYLNTNEGRHLPVPHCLVGTEGSHIVGDLFSVNSLCLGKDTFGSLNWRECGINGWDHIEIIGVCTDICVITNALILKTMFPEADITVDASCCAGTDRTKHLAALEVMRSCQINVINAI